MIFKATFMTSDKTLTGHQPTMEELIAFAVWAKSKPSVFRGHDETKEPIGRILSAEITPRENGTIAFVEGEIEIFDNGMSREELKVMLGNGALSPSYTDGGFTVGLNNRKFLPPLEIEFDAYSANEASLFFAGESLSKQLETPIRFVRVRRHALVNLAWIASTIGAHFLNKILDDAKLYETFKNVLVETSQETSEGKEIWIKIEGASGQKEAVGEIQVVVRGSDGEIRTILGSQEVKNILREKAKEAILASSAATRKIYTVERSGNSVQATLVRQVELGKKMDISH